MIRTYHDIEQLARRTIGPARYGLLLDRSYHAPAYHSFSVLRHIRLVIIAAERIRGMCGVDARDAAVYHDLGKLRMFATCDVRDADKFDGHEARSAEMAEADGISEAAVFAIRNHDAAYRKDIAFDPSRFVALAPGDVEKLRQLVVICAADAAGKGFRAPGSIKQRPQIAFLLWQVAHLHLEDGKLAHAVRTAAEEWR